jgi:hypothetical protein
MENYIMQSFKNSLSNIKRHLIKEDEKSSTSWKDKCKIPLGRLWHCWKALALLEGSGTVVKIILMWI